MAVFAAVEGTCVAKEDKGRPAATAAVGAAAIGASRVRPSASSPACYCPACGDAALSAGIPDADHIIS